MTLKTLAPIFLMLVSVRPSNGDEPKPPTPLKGKVTWSYFPGGEVYHQIVLSGKLCLATVIGQHSGPIPGAGQGKVAALDAENGKLVWEFKIGARSPGPIRIWKNLALFGSEEGAVFAVALDSGKSAWKVAIKGNLAVSHGLAVIGDSLAAVSLPKTADSNAATTLFMLNCKDGSEVWKQEGFVHQVVADSEGKLFAGSPARITPQQFASVAAIDPSNGKRLWSFEPYKRQFGIVEGLVVDSEKLYFATHNSLGNDSTREAVYAVKKADGKLSWKAKLENNVRTGPFLLNGKVYATDWSDRTVAVDAKSGEDVWSMGLGHMGFPLWDGVVLQGMEAYDMTAGAKNGKLVWKAEPRPQGGFTRAGSNATPVRSGERLFAVTHNNFIARVRTAVGSGDADLSTS